MTGVVPTDGQRGADLLVELCGLPGAGKTTLARQLVERLSREVHVTATVVDRDVSAEVGKQLRLLRKARLVLGAVGAAPRRELNAARRLATDQLDVRDRVAVPVQWWTTRQLMARARQRGGLCVAEEGLVQALWTAGLRSRSLTPADLAGLAPSAGSRPALVVHLDAPAGLALDRLRARESRHSRVQRLPDHDQAELLRHGERLLRDLVHEWSRRQLAEVLHVSVTGHPEADPVTTVLHHLLRMGATQPVAPSPPRRPRR